MFGDMGERIVKESVAVVFDDAIDIALIGLDPTKWRDEILSCQCEAMPRIVRGSDDDEQPGISSFDQFSQAEAVGDAAASVVHVRQKHSAHRSITCDTATGRTGKAWAAFRREQSREL